MRYIEKDAEPACLRQFIDEQTAAVEASDIGGLAVVYKQMTRTQELREDLSAQQGRLCGYTGERLPPGHGHVEHIKPQHLCKAETEAAGREWGKRAEEDLDYQNLIAAATRPLPRDRDVRVPRAGETDAEREARLQRDSYGAKKKDRWYRPDMVKPTEPDCETRLLYLDDGRVVPLNPEDEGADETITALNLNHPTLRTAREGSIRGQLTDDVLGDPTGTELQDVILAAETPLDGELIEFGFAIIQSARRYLA